MENLDGAAMDVENEEGPSREAAVRNDPAENCARPTNAASAEESALAEANSAGDETNLAQAAKIAAAVQEQGDKKSNAGNPIHDSTKAENEKMLKEAREKIANHFKNAKCFQFPEDEPTACNTGDVMNSVNSAFEVLRLLEQFPVLASEKYACHDEEESASDNEDSDDEDDDLRHFPIVFFVVNDFDTNILEKVMRCILTPSTTSMDQGPVYYTTLVRLVPESQMLQSSGL